MSESRAATVAGWWPWLGLPLAAAVLVTLGLSIDLLSGGDHWITGEAWFNVPGAVGFAIVAAGIWSTRPHPRGLGRLASLYTVVGLAAAAVLPAYGWARLDREGSLLAAWVSNWVWALGAAPLLALGLLLYPDGRLPGRAWWPAAAVGLLGTSSLVLAGALAPGPLDNHPAFTNPVGVGTPALWRVIGSGGFPLVMIAAVAGLLGLVLKFRRADRGGDVRGQIGGFALAGLLVVVAAVVPPSATTAQTTLALASGVALPAAVGHAVLRHRLLDQRQELATLHARVARLSESRREIVSEREEERAFLRRELHDGIGPSLAAIGLGLRQLEGDPEPQDTIRALADEVQRAVAEVRRICAGLRPAALNELGLAGALSESLAALDRFGPRVTIRIDPLGPLQPAIEVAAYRVVMEASTNAVRHARAQHVSVSVEQAAEGLVLRVEDDGHGLRPGLDRGVGIAAMRARVEELDGSFELTSDDTGTRVAAWLPVRGSDG